MTSGITSETSGLNNELNNFQYNVCCNFGQHNVGNAVNAGNVGNVCDTGNAANIGNVSNTGNAGNVVIVLCVGESKAPPVPTAQFT